MKYKKFLIGSFFSIALISLLSFILSKNYKQIEILYIKVFKKTVSLVQKDSTGQWQGEAFLYKEGRLSQKGNFINGLMQGWMTWYNENGDIEGKIYYNQGKEDGPEYVYYKNGKLQYTGQWKSGKRFGSLLYNDENGKPNVNFSIAIDINNIQQNNLVIKDNTVLISNAFDKRGDYIITLHEQIQDKKNKLLKDDSFKMTIKKA